MNEITRRGNPFFLATVFCLLFFAAGQLQAASLPDLVPLVKKLKPVVVNISTTQTAASSEEKEMPEGLRNSPFEEFFRHFLDKIPKESFKSRSLGSGVLIDAKGFILTNNHVVADADKIMVRLFDEREFPAKVVGRDSKTDLALIQIEAGGDLPVAKLGDSEKAEVGSWVVAIGNPFGLDATVTAGIISARGRMIGSGPYDNFLQTDAAINPGNSGGPLFNLDGEVIGINTAIFSRSGGSMGIGFAIPINMAKPVVEQLKKDGRVTRGWLGVRIQTVTAELAKALGLDHKKGALVASVEPDSPALKAGVMSGDVIVQFNGHDVQHMKELPAIVAQTEVGKVVPMKVIRNGKIKTIRVVVAVLEEGEKKEVRGFHRNEMTSIGMTVQPLTAEMMERLNVPDGTQGVIVTEVDKKGVAGESEVRPGDVIIEINRRPVKSLSDYKQLTKIIKPGSNVLILLLRGGDPHFLAIQIPHK
ncbi:MAG: DegQ family serine endoprotease [Magnetococcales bacterium]|nr:DegQ family serine endoprotease [Magnetococcales bacterium]